jgi:small-conductance mechanosensitive channel
MGVRQAPSPPTATAGTRGSIENFDSFDEIYRTTPASHPHVGYSILKVAAMLKSSHLSGMNNEAKRAALMMALEAAGAEVKDIIQDAMLRQRALNDYEDSQQKRLREFEAASGEENRAIQAELDRITAQYMAQIQLNVDAVARQQDLFRAWQKSKLQESNSIAEALSFCSAQENSMDTLSAVLERATARR